jgi:glycolate oxidase
MVPRALLSELERVVGEACVRLDPQSLEIYGHDALNQGHPPDVVVLPASTPQVSAVARLCTTHRIPLVVRGGGTGYTGGAVPVRGGVLLSLERMNRILEIDQDNLLAVVEPNVVTGDLQDAVEAVGLFYPPDPSSLRESAIGGNVAECAGGPRAFKYGTTKRYVLGLEAVLPDGEIIRTGSKTVKNVVGYDLTQLLVGSEGTLAILTKIILRLVPKPPVQRALRATFTSVAEACSAVGAVIKSRVVPASLELIDRDSLEAASRHSNASFAPRGTGALLVVEVDGFMASVDEEIELVARACASAGASHILRASSEEERNEIWRVRRELSPALRETAPLKINHDVVVPRGRIPDLFDLVAGLRREFQLTIACFGHAGDGNIHVNFMLDPAQGTSLARARQAERRLFEGVVKLEGSISGEHGIGFSKARYLGIELSAAEIALMKRIKHAFDPHGILNPGKIFPEDVS